MDYPWPGNVRELKSALEYAFVIAEQGKIDFDHLPATATESPPIPKRNDNSIKAQSERQALIDALRKTGGNQTQAARLLGVNRVTVWNRMRKYGLDLNRVLSV
jgi:transcriptional regulator of acetoin/glycerol metabolism